MYYSETEIILNLIEYICNRISIYESPINEDCEEKNPRKNTIE